MRFPALRLSILLVLVPLCLAQQEPAAKPSRLAHPVDISVGLDSRLDMALLKAGDAVEFKVTQDVRDGGQTVIPKHARLIAKVTLAKAATLQSEASLAFVVEQATWKDNAVLLRGYVQTTFKSSSNGTSPSDTGPPLLVGPRAPLPVGRLEFSPAYGTMIHFFSFAFAGCEMGGRPECGQVVPSDASFVVRHLPDDYQLSLLRDDKAFEKARTTVRSAGEGAPEGEFTLAEMYRTGQYMVKDNAKAFSWYARAAEHGHPTAQMDLAVCYARGVGTPLDFAAAYKWFYLSANSGVEASKQPLHVLEQRLSPSQIAGAVAQAKEWMAQHPKKP